MMRARVSSDVRALAIATAMVALAGCQAATPILDPLFGNPSVKAVHTPDNVTTLIFVDDPSQRLPNVPMAGLIADRAARDLQANEAITNVIEPRKLDQLRLNQPGFHTWAIDRIGRTLGAKQVIYVLVDSFVTSTVADHGELARPIASVRVKIVDVVSGRRLFPDSSDGHVLGVKFYYKQAIDGERGTRQLLERKLADRVGEDIAKIFYDHTPRDLGEPLQD